MITARQVVREELEDQDAGWTFNVGDMRLAIAILLAAERAGGADCREFRDEYPAFWVEDLIEQEAERLGIMLEDKGAAATSGRFGSLWRGTQSRTWRHSASGQSGGMWLAS